MFTTLSRVCSFRDPLNRRRSAILKPLTPLSLHTHFCLHLVFHSFIQSSHIGLFTYSTEAYSQCDCCWKAFPPSPEGLFRPWGCCSDGIRGGLERVHVWSRAGPCSGDPPTSMLLSCFPATHSRCQAMEKMLQTFPGMKRIDKNSSFSTATFTAPPPPLL